MNQPQHQEFPAEILRAAEQRVAHRLRHVTTDSQVIEEIRKLAVHRSAERLVHESRNRGPINPR